MESVLKFFADEWSVIWQAPAIFLIAFALLAWIAYLIASWRFGQTIGNLTSENGTLRERLQLRDDRAAEYEKKLQGASPDQARAEIDELKRQVSTLMPPRLTEEQKRQIVAVASKAPAMMQVIYDGADPDGYMFAQDFTQAFHKAGWERGTIDNHGGGGPHHLVVNVPRQTTASEVAIAALHAAGIEFAVEHADAMTFGRDVPDLALEIKLPARLR